MAGKEKFTQKEMIAALRKTKGMVYLAADELRCKPRTVYNYMEKYPDVRAEHESQNGMFNDVAELKLYQAVQNGEAWAIQFRLRMMAKDRGYSERTEVTGADGEAILIRLDR